jgi:hypothetical protein
MKFINQFALAAFALAFLMALMPASAYASRDAGTARMHTETVHDRTPTVHTHGAHPRHG